MGKVIIVNVRWMDGYREKFECSEVRAGVSLLWMRLISGGNRNIPLIGNVRAYSIEPEDHFNG